MTICILFCFFFYFFQAEDGIRDTSVTGVQTCALPILPAGPVPARVLWLFHAGGNRTGWQVFTATTTRPTERQLEFEEVDVRSEERRVGKEGRSGWGEGHKKEEDE